MAASGLSEGYLLAAWVVAGLISMCGAFIVAGLSNLTEDSGGIYEYLRLAFGPFIAFFYGWTAFTILGSASVAAIAYIFPQAGTFDMLTNMVIFAGFYTRRTGSYQNEAQ